MCPVLHGPGRKASQSRQLHLVIQLECNRRLPAASVQLVTPSQHGKWSVQKVREWQEEFLGLGRGAGP